MAYTLLNVSYSQSSNGDDFICAECGEGFNQYQKLISHMAIHGPTDPLSSNDKVHNNGCDAPIEFALHENGTLTVVDKSAVSNFSFLFGKPTSKPLLNDAPPQDSLPFNKTIEKIGVPCRCERCGQVFRSQKNLQQHQRYRPLEQGFKCTLCCKVYYDRESLRLHLQNHDQERFYSCGHCGKRFLKQETLSLHQKEWHSSLGSKSRFDDDDRENAMDKSYPCKVCDLRFFWLSDLQSHLMTHSHVNKSAADAKQKEKEQEESSLKKSVSHSTDASLNRSYRCGLCGGQFKSLTELKEHHASEHTDDEEEEESSEAAPPPKQSPVNYYGIMRQMVSKHQMQHNDPLKSRIKGKTRGGARGNHNSKVFPCKQCHRVFVHSSSLSRHMRYHKGTLHTCVYCGRHFPQRCDVTRHVAMYHGSDVNVQMEGGMLKDANENDNQLPTKKQKSNDSDDQENQEEIQDPPKSPDNDQSLETQDMLSHKPRMSYKCKECGRVFGLLSVYQRHVRYHRRDPSRVLLSCPICPCRFTFRSALDRHLENHEKEGAEKKSAKEGALIAEAQKDLLANDVDVEKSGHEDDLKAKAASDVLYECTECTQTFTDLQMFLQHQSAHG
ncbi:zinc finger protein 41 [Astyanax mexicanus]|uniref:Zinc finger protein 41 n=1 Tax=Astyanax mexicanus TaxID=7994 RepID=A0A8B9JT46_ASTMX|nr:zinc finger protein 41 [Astyanax mexicanus]